MKKFLTVLAVLLLIGVIVFLLGPRLEVDQTLHPVTLPDDLDRYLAESEAQYDDLWPNVEKTIIWADSSKARTPISIIYLHGFSATRQETAPLADSLAARLGANLFYTRLRGHGRPGAEMAEASVNDWLNDTYEALEIGRRLGDRILVMGVSTGATLATWLAARTDVEDVLALVFVSPNYQVRDESAPILLMPWGTQIGKMVAGPEHTWEPYNEAQGRYWTTTYPVEAVASMMGLLDVVDDLDLGTIDRPTLILYSERDQVVNPSEIKERFPEFGATQKQLVPLNDSEAPSHHVLAGAITAPNDTERVAGIILDFLKPLLR